MLPQGVVSEILSQHFADRRLREIVAEDDPSDFFFVVLTGRVKVFKQAPNGHDLILDDLAFEFLGDSLRVRFRDDECICEPAVLVAELEAAIREEAPL